MKLNYRRTFFVGLAFLSITAFWQVYDSIIPLILRNVFDVSDTLAGAIMAADNVLALFMLPLFGMISDSINTRLGKRMPFILGGTAGALLMLLLIPLSAALGNMVLFFVSLILVLLFMATFRSPAVALMPDITPKPLRSKANSVINLMGAIGGVLMLIALRFLTPGEKLKSYFPLFLVLMVLMAGCTWLLYRKVDEPRLAEQMRAESLAAGIDPDNTPQQPAVPAQREVLPPAVKRSLVCILSSVFLWYMGYNAVTTAFSKYVQIRWGIQGGGYASILMIATVSAVVSYLPAGAAASRIGRKKTILAGVLLLAAAFGGACFFSDFSPVIFVFFAMAGIGWASINVNSYPMVVEISKDSDVGRYTGYYYTFSMAAQIITPILSGAVLEYLGYQFLFPYAFLFVGAAFFTMLMVQHGDSRPDLPQDKLDAFGDL